MTNLLRDVVLPPRPADFDRRIVETLRVLRCVKFEVDRNVFGFRGKGDIPLRKRYSPSFASLQLYLSDMTTLSTDSVYQPLTRDAKPTLQQANDIVIRLEKNDAVFFQNRDDTSSIPLPTPEFSEQFPLVYILLRTGILTKRAALQPAITKSREREILKNWESKTELMGQIADFQKKLEVVASRNVSGTVVQLQATIKEIDEKLIELFLVDIKRIFGN